MKHSILLLLVIFLFKVGVCQQWHSAKEPLLPHALDSGYHTSIQYFDYYYELECVYVKKGKEYIGFKWVVMHNGQPIDNKKTIGVFYDKYLKRVGHVDKYYLK